ncbi:MAG TPA: porin family protein [Flavipsychrobacter sp.]|nr:porin family protein [Flavipsychrobacter sp.]
MKNVITILGLGFLAISQAKAQRVTIGPEAGLSITNQVTRLDGDRLESDPKLGLKLGGVVDIRLNRMVSLQPGMFFVQKGSKQEYIDYKTIGGVSYREMERFDTRLNYMEIPLNLQLYFGNRRSGYFFMGAGPYVAVALNGREDYRFERRLSADGNRGLIDSRSDSYDLEIGDRAADDDIKSGDAGMNFNMGFMTRHGFFMRGNLGVGMSNILPGGDSDYRQHNVGGSVTMGFLFGN